MNQNKMGQADTGAHQEDSKELAQYEEEKNCGKPEDTETEKQEEKFSFHLLEHGKHLLKCILTKFKYVRLNCIKCDIFNVNLNLVIPISNYSLHRHCYKLYHSFTDHDCYETGKFLKDSLIE